MPWDVQVRLRRLLLPLLSWRQMRLPSQQASLFPSMGADMPCAQDEKIVLQIFLQSNTEQQFRTFTPIRYAKEFKGKRYIIDFYGVIFGTRAHRILHLWKAKINQVTFMVLFCSLVYKLFFLFRLVGFISMLKMH